jgi:NAD(P)H-dependent flavin oxidoreductase YrpB (nitropropane dioxygenase family)
MKTRITEMFGIELPIFAFSHCRDVVVAVSKAGGMGVLGVSGHSPEQIERELAWIDAHIDGKPYGVDVLMPQKAEKVVGHKMELNIPPNYPEFLKKLCDEAGVPALPAGEAERMIEEQVTEINMTPDEAMELLETCLRHPVKLVVNALGTPPKSLVDDLHARGIKVGSLVGRIDHAQHQVDAGVDILVAQGCEAGGHTGTITSMVLWPQVIDAVAPIPVLAAGGVGRGRQMAAAMAMGAEGVWCGSIWLGTTESELTGDMRERFYAARSEDAVQSRALTGKPCRTLRSRFTDAWEQPEAPKPLPMPLQSISNTEARLRFERAHAKEWITYPVGQIVGDMNGDTTVRQVVQEMLGEFVDSVERLGNLLEE